MRSQAFKHFDNSRVPPLSHNRTVVGVYCGWQNTPNKGISFALCSKFCKVGVKPEAYSLRSVVLMATAPRPAAGSWQLAKSYYNFTSFLRPLSLSSYSSQVAKPTLLSFIAAFVVRFLFFNLFPVNNIVILISRTYYPVKVDQDSDICQGMCNITSKIPTSFGIK